MLHFQIIKHVLFSFRYADYKDTVLAMVADVVRIRFQGEIPK